ncbi:hypothetical protein GCM10007894_11570 [Paraferrimonas haliotis]|uniref:Lipid A 3-O-deacylase (PagL) n=2 Tax=Paraferrimonas haliotis TaxID=2013866 RepID=A0AA37WXZ1_9GAMM|nr:hypothetical protein GCM10007894_11570 [Paraferrimonas haliotis]
MSYGNSPQPGGAQDNQMIAADLLIQEWQRSDVQRLSWGASITHLKTNAIEGNSNITALSLFPELKLLQPIGKQLYYFQVRALGPTWLSEKQLGDRYQASQFALLAQVGAGMYFGPERNSSIGFFYRHFSNANIDQPNDGLDVLFNLSFGHRF